MSRAHVHTERAHAQADWARWVGLAGLAALVAAGCAYYLVAAARQRRITVAGPVGDLNVEDVGSAGGGLPVLFVHSYAGSTGHWDAQLAHLSPSRRVVAMDLRGHGLSAAPAEPAYAISALADDVAAVADAQGLGRFVLVGHSMGGMVAADYAGKHPERVAGLALIGCPGKSPADLSQKVMSSLAANYEGTMLPYWESLTRGGRPAVRRRLDNDMRRLDRATSMALIGALFENDPLPALAAYPGPKTLIDTPHGDGPAALYRQAPQIPRQLISGTSHWPQLDEPDKVNAALDAFLATVG